MLNTIWIGVMKNVEWVFSGIGVFFISAIFLFIKNINKRASNEKSNVINNNINFGGIFQKSSTSLSGNAMVQPDDLSPSDTNLKQNTRILFVDDDTRFRVVKILQNSGWPNVKIVKDILSLESLDLIEATILFIDIQGVGKALQFSGEGLGLAAAIKRKYPDKKIVIYSSQTSGERFHDGFRLADDSLPKNADPYEFIRLVEKYAGK